MFADPLARFADLYPKQEKLTPPLLSLPTCSPATEESHPLASDLQQHRADVRETGDRITSRYHSQRKNTAEQIVKTEL